MRLAALYDIHGNLPALEAVLADIHQANVDQLLVGGDVFPGPMPVETLSCLLDDTLPVQFIQGNGDRAVREVLAGADAATVPEAFRDVVCWTARQLRREHERLLANWPKTLSIQVLGLGEALFCHATPRSDTEIFTRLTPEDRLWPAFEGVNAGVVICGHTHMQFDRMLGKIRVVNSGSVGMPFGDPGAHWLLLGPDVELRHTRYHLANAAERIRATSYPQARDFAENYVLQPPSECQMLQVLGRGELK